MKKMKKNSVHITKDGKEIKISNLTDSHLKNIIIYQKKLAKKGIDIFGYYDVFDGMFYDSFYIYGESVLKELNHKSYLVEYKKRKSLKDIAKLEKPI